MEPYFQFQLNLDKIWKVLFLDLFECNVLIFASAFEIIPQAAQDEKSKNAKQIIASR